MDKVGERGRSIVVAKVTRVDGQIGELGIERVDVGRTRGDRARWNGVREARMGGPAVVGLLGQRCRQWTWLRWWCSRVELFEIRGWPLSKGAGTNLSGREDVLLDALWCRQRVNDLDPCLRLGLRFGFVLVVG
jgi:hypothetical protein